MIKQIKSLFGIKTGQFKVIGYDLEYTKELRKQGLLD